MRKIILSAAVAAIFTLSAAAQPQQSDSMATTASSGQPDSLAAASRKARDQKKDAPKKSAKVYTNDDMPTAGGISTVGAEPPAGGSSADASGGATGDKAAPAKTAAPDEEKTWRDKFSSLHHKLDQDQSLLDVDQRELSVDQLQYYGGNPNAGYQDQASQKPMGEAYTKKLAEIDQKKKDIEADKQAIADAEDDLRKAGGDPGWAR
jgi:hypothetical protein